MMNREDYVLMGPMALMQHCEALERDAARYRWLRNQSCEGNGTSTCPGVYMSDDNCLLSWKELDAAVDAELARLATPPEGHRP